MKKYNKHNLGRPADRQSARALDSLGEDIMRIELAHCVIRSYRVEDAESLALNANNRKIWKNLRDGFPNPYGIENANIFIQKAMTANPETMYAICVEGFAVGGIGFTLHSDIERISAEVGYWLGEPFWSRGIVTEALKAVTKYAIERQKLLRVYAVPFESNKASHRVLEKSGYQLEGRMRKSAIKDGKVMDQFLYAYII
jgi:ribosomal-protein-alanine N-acetyltransferase